MFTFVKLWCLIYLPVITRQDASFDYCKLVCKVLDEEFKHTLCENKCIPKAGVTSIESDDTFRNRCLHYHNRLRNGLAQGKVTYNGLGQAANMMVLNYDKELEYVARCWIDLKAEMVHDHCRITERFNTVVGQNLYAGTFDLALESTVKMAHDMWFSEYIYTKPDMIDKLRDPGNLGPHNTIYHFTQLIWAETTHIGCARNKQPFSQDPKIPLNMLVCNYGPGGNNMQLSIYKKGAPASKCPSGTKPNEFYKGLCGKIEEAVYTPSGPLPDDFVPIKGGGGGGVGSISKLSWFLMLLWLLLLKIK